LVALAFLAYYRLTKEYRQWEGSGVATIKPTFPFGNMLDIWKGKKTMFDLHKEFYRKLKGERYVFYTDKK
jgi:hypothetical protein